MFGGRYPIQAGRGDDLPEILPGIPANPAAMPRVCRRSLPGRLRRDLEASLTLGAASLKFDRALMVPLNP
jgi:hypothetical protein